ncbi:MAG: YdcF family protein [Rhodocyclaceae bacterium]|nr:MAG: YdcF family protein [Rhodocyclaceae bacterium]
MSLAWLFKTLLGTLLLPPANGLALLGVAGLFRRRRWAFGLAVLATVLLVLQSLPLVADSLLRSLESRAGPVLEDPAGAQAVVVLGSGLLLEAAEYGGDTASERTLVRTRYGATVARRFGLPVLVSGGRPVNATRSEAEVMAGILTKEFGVPVRWQENRSQDTADNAAMSAEILKAAGIRRIVLVTQAFHMPRAVSLFRAAGLEVIPAPTYFMGGDGGAPIWLDLLPRASALQRSYYALHEWLWLAWLHLAAEAKDLR